MQQLAALRQTAQETLEEAKRQMKRAKEKREERRREAALPNGAPMTPEEESALIRESQFQKAEYKRMERCLERSGLLPYSKRFPIMGPAYRH